MAGVPKSSIQPSLLLGSGLGWFQDSEGPDCLGPHGGGGGMVTPRDTVGAGSWLGMRGAGRTGSLWEGRKGPALDAPRMLAKESATHSSILAWKIPWTEEPGRLWSTQLQRVGHD